jgi:DNA-binding XRE family transcriptional regulator
MSNAPVITPEAAGRFVSGPGEFTITLSPEQQARWDALHARQRQGGKRSGRQTASVPKRALASLRTAQGRTQADLAAALGVSRPTIVRIEHQDDVLLSTLVAYLAELDAHVEIVFGDQHITLGPDTQRQAKAA